MLRYSIILLIVVACNSMLQNKGVVNYYNTLDKSEKMYYTNNNSTDESVFIDYKMIDKSLLSLDVFNNNVMKNKEKSEVRDMESMLTELTTAITSAIAGVYCLVKVILNIVSKFKKSE